MPDRASDRQAETFASVEHLSLEAVAAFVDHELSPGAMRRAACHLARCEECRREVSSQWGAADIVHSCNDDVRAPSELVARLKRRGSQPPGPGPGAEATPTARSSSLTDLIETLVRMMSH